MSANYDGLTRNSWPGTWSPTADHPIVLDREIRGGLRTVSGASGDRLSNITGQRLEVGMMVYLQQTYSEAGEEFLGDRYYIYRSLAGESRNINTGELPNANGNWQIFGSDIIDLSSVSENIIPASDKNFDLGSAAKQWNGIYAQTLYLGTNTIFLGSDTLTLDDQGNLLVNGQPVIEQVRFFVAGDDSNVRTINANETVKFIGSNGITTATDDEGNVTIIGSLQDLTPYATTDYVDQEISALLSSAPETLDTLKELADALGNDENFSTSILTALSNKLDKTDQYKFKVAGDDSSVVEINNRETVKFVGGVGISTSTDPEGNITFNGFSGDWNDLSNVPNFSVVSSTGSYLDLLDKPYIPLDYAWRIAGDDSVQRTVSNGETVKFIGTNGVSTNTDDEGNVTITGTIPDLSPYATTVYVDTQISELINGAPDLLNTLSELAQALDGDENFAANVITILDNKLDKSQQYRFSISADDSVLQQIDRDESVKFIGGVGISTLSDGEGNITINGFSGSYQDLDDIPEEFSFNIESSDSSVFTVRNGSNLRLTGNLGIDIEGDSSEGFVISGPDLSAIEQSLVPAVTEQYDLGSPTKRWKDLYLSGNTISLGSITISAGADGNSLEIDSAGEIILNGALIKAKQGHIELPPGSTLDGSPLITRVELIENSFEMNIVVDESVSRPIQSGDDLRINGAGGTTTTLDAEGDVVVSSIDKLNELSDVNIDSGSLAIGKVLKYNGQSWVAAAEAGSVEAGSGSGDAATLNGFDGTHYLNYNNLTNTPDPYELPPATADTLGGVRIGENINVNNGTISVPTGAGINKVVDIPDVVDDELADGAILAYNGGAVRWETRGLDLTNSVMDGGFY